MEHVPFFVVLAIGCVGFVLMVAAFVLVARRGGWPRAMQADAEGRWPLPRKLMFAGASLGCLFGMLIFVPGVIPWWEYSWGHGAVFGFFLSSISRGVVQFARQRAGTKGQPG